MSVSNSTILVTGGAGYIGSVLVGELLSHGYHVRVIDNLMYGQSFPEIFQTNKNLELITGDIRNTSDVDLALKGVKAVVHLAAIVGDPACDNNRDLALEVNRVASELLYRKSLEHKVERFVFASTCSNYGKMENHNGYVDELSELKPISHYARLKVDFEKFILNQNGQLVPAVVLRFATAYGLSPRIRLDLTLNEFTVSLALGKKLQVYGEQFWRPYAHTSDLASACIFALKANSSKITGKAFNVGATHENYQKKTLIEKILRELPQMADKVEFVKRDKDPRDYRVNFDLIKKILEYKNSKNVNDGIREFIEAVENYSIVDFDSPLYRNA